MRNSLPSPNLLSNPVVRPQIACAGSARHDKTYFPVDSEFYMTFLGPLTFIKPDGSPIAVIGWEDAQNAYGV
jgi:hypothetical protein